MAPVIQCHRGYGDLAPHNTLVAFRSAAADPSVTSVEFDVQTTSDGHLVVTHGPELAHFASLSLVEAQAVDLGQGERVPLLADVIDVCLQGKLHMNVEIKRGCAPAAILRTIDMLREKKAMGCCQISSFDRSILQIVMEAAPALPIGCLYQGSLGFVDPEDKQKGVRIEDEPEDFVSWFISHKVEGDSVNLRSEKAVRNPKLIDQVRAGGKKVMVWFPSVTNHGYEDGEEMYKRLLDLDVDVICVNRPDILYDLISGKGVARAASEIVKPEGAPTNGGPVLVPQANSDPQVEQLVSQAAKVAKPTKPAKSAAPAVVVKRPASKAKAAVSQKPVAKRARGS